MLQTVLPVETALLNRLTEAFDDVVLVEVIRIWEWLGAEGTVEVVKHVSSEHTNPLGAVEVMDRGLVAPPVVSIFESARAFRAMKCWLGGSLVTRMIRSRLFDSIL